MKVRARYSPAALDLQLLNLHLGVVTSGIGSGRTFLFVPCHFLGQDRESGRKQQFPGGRQHVARIRAKTAAALLARQRNNAIEATYDWQVACSERDRVIQEQDARITALEAELNQSSLRLLEMHPTIFERCHRLIATGHFEEAVATAMKAVEVEVRTRSGAQTEDIGTTLMAKAMVGANPAIRFSTVKSEQEAVHSLYRGAVGWFRNPVVHRFRDIDSSSALEMLAVASHLIRMLDAATVVPLVK